MGKSGWGRCISYLCVSFSESVSLCLSVCLSLSLCLSSVSRDATFLGNPGIWGLKICPGGAPIEWKKAPGEAFLTYNYSKPGRKNANHVVDEAIDCRVSGHMFLPALSKFIMAFVNRDGECVFLDCVYI